ncbi:MAG: hypothetical protein JW724_01825 [Candidatus Altiarchaeota archaeon]|nr:hypothetical protein [Candidatus Altiarchaeota archaeon]
MREFKITGEGLGETRYVVLKCPACGRIQRFCHRREFFGKVPKNAGCKQCQKSFSLEENSLEADPLPVAEGGRIYALKEGGWEEQKTNKVPDAGFTTADKL